MCGRTLTINQNNSLLETVVAYPLIIIITLYMVGSAVVPFLEVNPHVFTTVFTLSAGIPAITIFFKEKFAKYKPNVSEQ